MAEKAITQLTRYQTRQQRARQSQIHKHHARLRREQVRAQRFLQSLEQALVDVGPPETVAAEVKWRLKAQEALLGKIFRMMFPSCVGLSQLP